MFQLKKHTVQRGDTLAHLARRGGLPSWRSIYYAACNESLRKKRPNPHLIQPGDVLWIPPKALEVAKFRLQQLKALRKESAAEFDKIGRELDESFRAFSRQIKAYDVAADVLLIFKDLAFLVADGAKALKLTGEKLNEANNALTKSTLLGSADNLITFSGSNLEVTGEEGIVWAFTKIVWKAYSDIQTPSFWAQLVTGSDDPKAIHNQAKAQVARVRTASLEALNAKIKQTEELVARLQSSEARLKSLK